jgi:hypothetical protein
MPGKAHVNKDINKNHFDPIKLKQDKQGKIESNLNVY